MPFVGELRPFQQQAHDQLLEWGRGLLAVTMGGGKTPTTIAITETLLDAEEVECGLIITPASLKHQWNGKRGFPLFAPDANVVVIDGDAGAQCEEFTKAGDRCRNTAKVGQPYCGVHGGVDVAESLQEAAERRRQQYLRAASWAEYIVLGYSQVVDDWNFVKRLPADFIVFDEAQAIKNPGSQRSLKMEKLLRRARKRQAFILGLTGQPLENKPEDVFHVCAGIDPEVLGHPEIFDKTFIVRDSYGKPKRYVNLDLLKKRLEERIMVRVEREEIEEYLPDRSEEDVLIPFDAKSLALYKTVVEDLVLALDEMKVNKNFDLAAHYSGRGDSPAAQAQRGKIMARLLCARMACDHPKLLQMSADMYDVTKVRGEAGSLKAGSEYAHALVERGELEESTATSPKFRVVVREIRKILEKDPANKVVLFSTFKPTLTWLKYALRHDTEAVLFHGGVGLKKREALKNRFNEDPDVRLFLSSDAGGAGVDLPAGNFLLNYNLPFSAGQLDQRNARIDRMSSEHEEMKILNFLMEGSVEEYYATIVAKRKKTAASAIDGRGSRSVTLPTTSLRGFLLDWLVALESEAA